ncbi:MULTISPECIES: TetR/AcrR family transcriptional regulator [Sphingobium]|uniref:TetR/AcrR family transcriptional regulator n=1 Tax=Sphingobium sp. MI1205 TaxID=407020 RepID=UPI0007705F4F|nr:TetR/AcrR family transcriptional regulator [Sphingobium sp. MI1205]AMK19914.1 TetR family transcriptional regulator [Sphingobium sp. MI1205]
MASGLEPTPAGLKVWEAASSLFYRHGIRAVGVAEISELSGVAKTNLYRNFRSKDGLVIAYLDEQARAGRQICKDALTSHPGDPKAQLRYIIRETAKAIGSPGYRGCPLANAAIEFPDRDHPVRQKVDELKIAFLENLNNIAAQMNIRKPCELAYAIMMLLEGASCSAQIFSAEKSANAAIEAADRVILSYDQG